MLSILIPVYNYDVRKLVNNVYSQCIETGIAFEIIICDDNSKKSYNLKFNKNNITILTNTNNIGRTETRQKLALNSKYDWLLFLDADVLPLHSNFIKKYIEVIQLNEYNVSYGGFKYESKKPSSEKILRWKYGKHKEEVSFLLRKKNPYKIITSANLLIQKELFKSINSELRGNLYGYDTIFSLRLKELNITIKHIDNPVWHLGLESNKTYLNKVNLATNTILKLYLSKQITSGSNDLLKAFELVKKLNFIKVISYFFRKTNKAIEANLLGKKPNITLLNIYKLGYFCNIYTNGN